MNEIVEAAESYITVTIYGKALPKFGEDDGQRTLTLLNLLADSIDVKDLNGVTDDSGTFTASFSSFTPMDDLTEKALTALEGHTAGINTDSNLNKTWRVDVFHENEADIAYDLENAQNFQLDNDWNWGLTSPPS